ncbi:unnamed protein product [Urochloa humidicola]
MRSVVVLSPESAESPPFNQMPHPSVTPGKNISQVELDRGSTCADP